MHFLKTVLNYQYDFWRTADGLGPIQMNLSETGQFLQLSRFQPALSPKDSYWFFWPVIFVILLKT